MLPNLLSGFLVCFCAIGAQGAVTAGQLSDLMTSLWHSDVNAATSVRVQLQGHTYTGSTSDRATSPLFSYVNDQYYFSRPTYAALLSLLDNYNHAVGSAEHTSAQESQEVTSFLDEISKTTVMQKAHDFLSQHGYVGPTWSDFETTLRQIWFATYPRHGGTYDSSGFEHVFVGETDSKGVVGFHNWIQFHLQEQKGNLDYLGYIFSKAPNTLGVHFMWLHKTKALGSFIYGTSPEFDIAMFTVCYLTHKNQHCNFSVDGHNMEVLTYEMTHGGGGHLGTGYVN
ncbi:uridylate-specific endoribonuclease D-like [Mya arenaria]|uniref:uridylate-specific endoribonuclease D-like n=1 Tax=Mya arenaria TaxID=6604 RepID=UPI0022E99446|nr:uridylate-specific endoribonuclease D-like [Mya arenaria]